MFENKIIRGIHASRYIMSWVRVGGELSIRGEGLYEFGQWLKSIGLNNEEVSYLKFLASNGKMELEGSARLFIRKQKELQK